MHQDPMKLKLGSTQTHIRVLYFHSNPTGSFNKPSTVYTAVYTYMQQKTKGNIIMRWIICRYALVCLRGNLGMKSNQTGQDKSICIQFYSFHETHDMYFSFSHFYHELTLKFE